MSFKKFTAKTVASATLAKKFVKALQEEVSYTLLLRSKKFFDPYTSTVYDDLMKERIESARIRKEAVITARKVVYETIDSL